MDRAGQIASSMCHWSGVAVGRQARCCWGVSRFKFHLRHTPQLRAASTFSPFPLHNDDSNMAKKKNKQASHALRRILWLIMCRSSDHGAGTASVSSRTRKVRFMQAVGLPVLTVCSPNAAPKGKAFQVRYVPASIEHCRWSGGAYSAGTQAGA